MAGVFRFTRHADLMIDERGLDRGWILRTIEDPVLVEADPFRPGRIRAFAPVRERDGRILRVVQETIDAETVVVTAYLDRGRSL